MTRAAFVPSLAALFALGAAACGGTGGERPSGTPPDGTEALDPCAAAEGYEFRPIVDFEPPEDQTPETTRFQQCDPASPCTFNFNYDVALSPIGEPIEGADCPAVVHFTDPGPMQSFLLGTPAGTRCGEPVYATHLVATELATCVSTGEGGTGRQGWGGSLSFTFSTPTGTSMPIDASEWDGFSFWVKKAGPRSRSAFIAAAVDPYTAGTRNIEDPFGGEPRSCDASGLTVDPATGDPIPDTEKCDGFGVAVTLSDDWTFVPVRFSSMRQKGFGMPSPLGEILREELVRIQFLISAGDWDFWIDDVAFFREPEP